MRSLLISADRIERLPGSSAGLGRLGQAAVKIAQFGLKGLFSGCNLVEINPLAFG